MNEKIFPANKIIIKKPEDIIRFDYVAPNSQQIFNYVILQALNKKENTINIKVADYYAWQNIIKPQGKHYATFYKTLEKLKHTFVVAQTIENNKIIKYDWPLIAETKTIKTLKNRIETIEIKLNPYLLNFFRWQRANVPINVNITKNLDVKYAYRLYEYLLYQQRKNKYINIDDLRRVLTAPKTERNERFLRYLEKALKNINETTDLKICAKIKTKNKKSLASAEIKFINLTEKISEKQFEFLIFERTLREKNGDL